MKNYVEFKNGYVNVKNSEVYCDPIHGSTHEVFFTHGEVMPDIADVEEIRSGDSVKVVRVLFCDNTVEKAVLSANDTYNLEDGISICVAKKLLSDRTDGAGTAVYNKIIDHAVKVMNKNREDKAKLAKEQEERELRKQKEASKKDAKRAKKEAEEREDMLNFYAEAYARAIRMVNSDNNH